jgi:tRNA (mo5U34)-methyltransferase
MEAAATTEDLEALKEEIIRLGPWHLDVQVTPELSTSAFLEAPDELKQEWERHPVTFIDHRTRFQDQIRTIYPDGLEGRRFLDCACNCGAYSFWMKELGADATFGFDVREHWINQARFLLEHRTWPSDGIEFEALDLYDLPKRELEPFDITLFKGIFYHLPDPITGLKLAADLTREVMIVNTAVRLGHQDGMLVLENEGTEPLMSGVHQLSWAPTGPEVMKQILNWMGFADTKLTTWVESARQPGRRGRLQMIGARKPGLLDGVRAVDTIRRQGQRGRRRRGARGPGS